LNHQPSLPTSTIPAVDNCGIDPSREGRWFWNLWEMLELDARELIEVIHLLLTAEHQIREKAGELTPILLASRDLANDKMVASLNKLELPVSVKTAEEIVAEAKTIEVLHSAMEQLWNTVALELDGRKFYGPVTKFVSYYEQPKLFGDEVFNKFPSANNDIFEAGTCLALERGTATVMHLMRVVEVGLKALASTLGGGGAQSDLGGYIREIDNALTVRTKAAGVRTPDEQFYAEARLTIDGVRIAWRNPTMDVENSYSPEGRGNPNRGARPYALSRDEAFRVDMGIVLSRRYCSAGGFRCY
jgi:hypothetical protein